MPDLQTQLRDYAGFAVDGVEPVLPDEVLAGQRAPAAARRRVPVRAIVAITAVAAAVAAAVVWVRPEDRAVRVAVQPAPTTSVIVIPAPPTSRTSSTAAPPEPAPPSLAARFRSTGIAGTRRHGNGETSIKVVTVSGETFWVTVPDDVPGVTDLDFVPGAAFGMTGTVGPRSFFTALPAHALANAECAAVPGPVCRTPTIQSQRRLGNGAALTLWEVGTVNPAVTVEMSGWTLSLDSPDTAGNERIAEALVWSVDGEGYLHLRSDDPEMLIRYEGAALTAGVTGEPADGLRINVLPGCDARPELNWPAVGPELIQVPIISSRPAYHGTWCAAGRYQVEVTTGDRALLNRLYERLRIEPAR